MRVAPNGYQAAGDCLADKVILVTGAAAGIGAAVARAYARHGAEVVLLDKDVAGLERVYDDIARAGRPRAALYPLDLEGAQQSDYRQLAATVEREFGRLNGLLHNAARRDGLTPLWRIEPQDWHETMQVNLHAPFMLTVACLELLQRAAAASVVFTTDHQARRHHAYWGAYGISKHATDALMRTLAEELENLDPPVRVNAIDPGAARTAMRVKTYPGLDPSAMTAPETITRSWLFLMDDKSRGVNGQVILAQG